MDAASPSRTSAEFAAIVNYSQKYRGSVSQQTKTRQPISKFTAFYTVLAV
jgi:hypothetical protein